MDETMLAFESAMKRGAEVGAAKGLSDARVAASVTMTTSGFWNWNAESTSFWLSGVPFMKLRFGVLVVGKFLARALTVWPLLRSSVTTREPVRPVAPKMRACIVDCMGR